MVRDRKVIVVISALVVVLMIVTGGLFFIIPKFTTTASTAASSIIWPLDVSGHDWYILNGYNDCALANLPAYDHGGCNQYGEKSQQFGFDLELRGILAKGQVVRSPVNGIVEKDFPPASDGTGVCIIIDYNNTADQSRQASLCHVSPTIQAGSAVSQGQQIATVFYDHLHFNIREPNLNPVAFTGSDQILGCGNSDFAYHNSSNEYAGYNISCFGYWMGPSPTGTNAYPIHLYGTPARRNIELGYHSNNSNGEKVDYVTFWVYQNGKWISLGARSSDKNQQEFVKSTDTNNLILTGPGYISVDVHTNDGKIHKAQDGIRMLCVTYLNGSNQCPQTGIPFWDGSTQPIGTGGGGTIESDHIVLCSDPNYGGTCAAFTAGSVNDLTSYDISGNVSSILVPKTFTLFMFDQTNQQGTRSAWNENVPDLSTKHWDNLAKSISVEQRLDTTCNLSAIKNGIILFHDRNYSPNGGCFNATTDINDLGAIAHTRISSLEFSGSYINTKKITLYKDANFGTICGTYALNQSDLRDCAQQDIVSLKIEDYTPLPGAQNIAASAVRDHPGSDAVVDDNLHTQWIAGHAVSLGFSFITSQTVQDVTVFDRDNPASDNNQINKVKIGLSNGYMVNDVDMDSGGARCVDISFPSQTVKWVTINPVDASGNNGYKEIQIWNTNGAVASQNNCINKKQVTLAQGTSPAPVATAPTIQPAPTSSQPPSQPNQPGTTPVPTQQPAPSPTSRPAAPTPHPTSGGYKPFVIANFNNGTAGWQLTNGVSTKNGLLEFSLDQNNTTAQATDPNLGVSLYGYSSIQFTMNTHGGIVSHDDWVILNNGLTANIDAYTGQTVNGTVTIPLSAFGHITSLNQFSLHMNSLDPESIDIGTVSLIV